MAHIFAQFILVCIIASGLMHFAAAVAPFIPLIIIILSLAVVGQLTTKKDKDRLQEHRQQRDKTR